MEGVFDVPDIEDLAFAKKIETTTIEALKDLANTSPTPPIAASWAPSLQENSIPRSTNVSSYAFSPDSQRRSPHPARRRVFGRLTLHP